MIIVDDNLAEKTIFFPRNIYNSDGEYKLVLTDRATKKSYEFYVLDNHLANYGYYSFIVDLEQLPYDEYEYSIFDIEDNIKVSKGIIRINSLDKNSYVYNKNNEYVIYEQN